MSYKYTIGPQLTTGMAHRGAATLQMPVAQFIQIAQCSVESPLRFTPCQLIRLAHLYNIPLRKMHTNAYKRISVEAIGNHSALIRGREGKSLAP